MRSCLWSQIHRHTTSQSMKEASLRYFVLSITSAPNGTLTPDEVIGYKTIPNLYGLGHINWQIVFTSPKQLRLTKCTTICVHWVYCIIANKWRVNNSESYYLVQISSRVPLKDSASKIMIIINAAVSSLLRYKWNRKKYYIQS